MDGSFINISLKLNIRWYHCNSLRYESILKWLDQWDVIIDSLTWSVRCSNWLIDLISEILWLTHWLDQWDPMIDSHWWSSAGQKCVGHRQTWDFEPTLEPELCIRKGFNKFWKMIISSRVLHSTSRVIEMPCLRCQLTKVFLFVSRSAHINCGRWPIPPH